MTLHIRKYVREYIYAENATIYAHLIKEVAEYQGADKARADYPSATVHNLEVLEKIAERYYQLWADELKYEHLESLRLKEIKVWHALESQVKRIFLTAFCAAYREYIAIYDRNNTSFQGSIRVEKVIHSEGEHIYRIVLNDYKYLKKSHSVEIVVFPDEEIEIKEI